MSDPYNVLGIERGSNTEHVKRAYRKLSLEHHPDRNGGSAESTEKFQHITAAYEKLINPKHNIHNEPVNMFTKKEITPEELMRIFATQHFPDIFNNLELHTRKQIPMTIVKNITITLQQAFTGCCVPLDIERLIIEGNIKKQETETIYINIPEGVDNNEILICRGKGNMIDQINIGDVKVFVKVEPVSGFERRGLELVHRREITLKQALCGFSFDIKHLSGKSYRIKNNKGNVVSVGSNKTYCGLGFTRDGHTGPLLIEYSIIMPSALSEEQIESLDKIL